MIEKKIWVLVANGSAAKILKAESNEQLTEIELFEHPESRLRNSELMSDGPGYFTQRGAGAPHFVQSSASPKLKEKDHFAIDIVNYLEKAFHEHEFEKLYVIANNQFLSLLHHHIKPDLKAVIAAEIHKDLTLMKFHDVRSYLPDTL
jgi:protein required for attachment to host cells